MGLTVHYRGTLPDLDLVETIEDRLIDLSLELGGYIKIWRSRSETKPDRMIRGAMVDLAPGLETVSLLVSPEGRILPLHEIAAAEDGKLDEAPWVFVKTQFGPVEAHVALIELLDALKKEFIPDLEVHDEGGYWEHRDVERLRTSHEFLGKVIDTMAAALDKHPLGPEAAEDPKIVAARVERIAELVHRALHRPPEHPPVKFRGDDDPTEDYQRQGTEAEWDAFFKEGQRRTERLMRAVDEKSAEGADSGEALDHAFKTESIGGVHGIEDDEENERPRPAEEALEGIEEDIEDDKAPWKQSLKPDDEDEEETLERPSRREHPLVQRATSLVLECMRLGKKKDIPDGWPMDLLARGVMEMSGGLVQAVETDDDHDTPFGLRIVQYKRALRGAAFARGSLHAARHLGHISKRQGSTMLEKISAIEHDVQDEMRKVRREWKG